MKKTNAMRILEQMDITYESRSYDVSDEKIDGISVADKTGLPYEAVCKTLAAHVGRDVYVFVIPVNEKLDLKKAAAAAGVKKLEMLPQKELKNKTGYIHGGCSPLGMKKQYPTFLSALVRDEERIAVSAGRIGQQMLLKPDDLIRAASAVYADLT